MLTGIYIARYRSGQLFVVLTNRFAAGSLGTPVTFYPPADQLKRYGDGTLWLINHMNPKDRIATDKTSLGGGFTASPVAGDGKVYFTSEEGEVYVVSDNQSVLSRLRFEVRGLPSKRWNGSPRSRAPTAAVFCRTRAWPSGWDAD